MITISEKIEELVNQSPYLREALGDKLVNLSALARQLKPQIETELMKDVTDSAVFMALQRYSQELKPYTAANPGQYLGNLTLRSDLIEITFRNSPTLGSCLSKLLETVEQDRSILFVFTQGIHETTVIASKSLETAIKKAADAEIITDTIRDLTAISLQRMHEHIEAVGVLMYPLRIVAWQGISVIEIVTTLNELMIVIRDKDVDRAVIAIRQALHTAAQQTAKD